MTRRNIDAEEYLSKCKKECPSEIYELIELGVREMQGYKMYKCYTVNYDSTHDPKIIPEKNSTAARKEYVKRVPRVKFRGVVVETKNLIGVGHGSHQRGWYVAADDVCNVWEHIHTQANKLCESKSSIWSFHL